MDTPDITWHLIAKTLNGEASRQEQEELNEILQNDGALQQQYDLLSRIWTEKETGAEHIDGESARSTISRIINKAEVSAPADTFPITKSSNRRRYWLAAASVVVLLGSAWFWLGNKITGKATTEQVSLAAPKGSRFSSILLDGTTVWLNAGSKLYYENDFNGATREVRLEGEAFFDVVKQPERPFIVHTSGIDIHVLGTSFNVKAYPEDKTVETTLYHGAVQVFRQQDTEKKAIRLKPNEKLILSKEAANEPANLSEKQKPTSPIGASSSFTIAHIDSTKKENERFETAWLYSRLEFRGDNFEELARKLERWYNVTIVFTDEKAKQLNFYGSFEKETIAQAFVALKTAVPFTYNIKGHEIFVGSAQ